MVTMREISEVDSNGQSQGLSQTDEHMTPEQLRNLDQMANTLRSGSPQEIERTIVEIRKLLSMGMEEISKKLPVLY